MKISRELKQNLERLVAFDLQCAPGPWTAENVYTRSADNAGMIVTDEKNVRICDTFNADGRTLEYEYDESGSHYYDIGQPRANMQFIAHARTYGPMAARLLLGLLQELDQEEKEKNGNGKD